MYPYLRVIGAVLSARRMPPLEPGDVHVIRTRCWPWDIDPFMELNNGRSMTLMDIGRIPTALRTGILAAITREGWRMTMAGACIQYRRRVPPFAKMEIRTRGGDVEVRINGHVTATLSDDPGRREGHFGLQLHGSQEMHVEYRNVEIREAIPVD